MPALWGGLAGDGMNDYAYVLDLTADEYRSACVMSDRGYLGEITRIATVEESEDGSVKILFTEPEAWEVYELYTEDYWTFWSLTTPSTSLGEKVQAFMESIV